MMALIAAWRARPLRRAAIKIGRENRVEGARHGIIAEINRPSPSSMMGSTMSYVVCRGDLR